MWATSCGSTACSALWRCSGERLVAASLSATADLALKCPDQKHPMHLYHILMCNLKVSHRLVVVGLPATVEHGAGRSGAPNSAAVVAEITAAFITCLDSVRLNMLAVDQVRPLHRLTAWWKEHALAAACCLDFQLWNSAR